MPSPEEMTRFLEIELYSKIQYYKENSLDFVLQKFELIEKLGLIQSKNVDSIHVWMLSKVQKKFVLRKPETINELIR